ncbi:Abortive infection bacteriophage resistance protein [Reichenbachiella agariperforans]|uniref:Abortive infection bacteriophage resistance protein n=2 Tax=Reichenbachiella agariperforans TaxID=156994 RepID=A0A1M6KSK2_REIAG|nr:Abortive infection bacteriophage resistance protein [Reichenbachiella agariperforans]
MLFRNEITASHFLANISYYRLKGYWWDMQLDFSKHKFHPNSYFEDVIDRYNFDRHLRLILFDAIERIEIALRTQMIYHLSLSYGSLWYQDANLFPNTIIHAKNLTSLMKEFGYSQEVFIVDHKRRFPNDDPESWKLLEIASLGTLSKIYKSLGHHLPEKAKIANGLGLNLHNELSSWLEAIVYVRNIIAHHSRLWSRNMVKRPVESIRNPKGNWFDKPLDPLQTKRPFLIISTMIYLCDKVTPNHQVKSKIIKLIQENPTIQIHKLGFLKDWDKTTLWK